MARECIDIEAPDQDAPCACGGCGWRGPARDLLQIEGCTLTPGDPSPAGRCPDEECESLAYLDRTVDRARDAGFEMLNLLRRICGREYVQAEFLAALDEARALLAKLDEGA